MSKNVCFSDVEEFNKFSAENSSRYYVMHNNFIYDITDYLEEHPGGPQSIIDFRDQDITSIFNDDFYHDHSQNALRRFQKYKIGYIQEEEYSTEKREQELCLKTLENKVD